MSIEQLLNPRVKLAIKYPGQPVPTGTILHKYETGGQGYYVDTPGTLLTNGCVFAEIVDEHLHLFKPLQWWEDRKLEEMPAYVKQEGMVDSRDRPIPDRVIKVDKHWANTATKPYGNYKVFSSSEDPHNHLYSQMYADWQPATLEEYLTYINSKK